MDRRRDDAGLGGRNLTGRRARAKDRYAAAADRTVRDRSPGERDARGVGLGACPDRAGIPGRFSDEQLGSLLSSRGGPAYNGEEPRRRVQPDLLGQRGHQHVGWHCVRLSASVARNGRVRNAARRGEAFHSPCLLRYRLLRADSCAASPHTIAAQGRDRTRSPVQPLELVARLEAQSVPVAISAADGSVVRGTGGVQPVRQRLSVAGTACSDDADRTDLLHRAGAAARHGTSDPICSPRTWVGKRHRCYADPCRRCARLDGGSKKRTIGRAALSNLFRGPVDEFSRTLQPADE